ncbi:MAG: hypothetical protein CVU08_02790 [Bacteroidetes bacterium HGW-Bacteroidetes-3]|jgi:hypothetical protein|nr:MAG: hypothetical protein CVU08_02790 [Bacteroidetes bacterium HGW-Bacteroidetes-3]
MKKQLFFLSALFLTISSFSQNTTEEEFKPSGDVQFKVFWNYHTDLSQNATNKSAFELKRSYFGYKYDFSKNISAKITFDVGSNTGGSEYTAFLKAAQLDWKVAEGVKLSMGMIGMKQFNDQEDFWGYRYIFTSYQDAYGFGTSADLGVSAEFTITKTLKANVLIVNGEGYKKLQDEDGNQRFGGNLVFEPIKGLTTKIYMDAQPTTNSKAVTALALFAGYKASHWRFGAEYNELNNGKKYSSPAVDHDLDGFSFYSTYIINKKFEIFGRYDALNSNTLTGQTAAWNFDKNGSQIIAGIQYAPVKGLKFSLNYQDFSFDNATIDNKSLVFLNAEFKL